MTDETPSPLEAARAEYSKAREEELKWQGYLNSARQRLDEAEARYAKESLQYTTWIADHRAEQIDALQKVIAIMEGCAA